MIERIDVNKGRHMAVKDILNYLLLNTAHDIFTLSDIVGVSPKKILQPNGLDKTALCRIQEIFENLQK